MINSNNGRTESAAAIAKHPMHPFLVAFPIAFLIGGFIADILFRHSADSFWLRGATWLIGAGLVTGILAAVTGIIDFMAISRARSLVAGWVHLIGNALALLLAAYNLWIHLNGPVSSIVTTGLTLSGVVVLIIGVTGWLGGELAYRHHIGMVRHTDNGADGYNSV